MAIAFLAVHVHLTAQDEDLYGFLVGRYQIVGRYPDSSATYTGTVVVSMGDSLLDIERTVGGVSVQGTGRIVPVTSDRIKVLRIRFTDQGRPFEGTFLIAGDLDNYGRLSGYIYSPENETRLPGLEAWFIDLGE
jgi:hypothetical protein